MNTFTGIVHYVGEDFTDDGLRFMKLSLPKVGKSGEDVPLYMMPNKAAGEAGSTLCAEHFIGLIVRTYTFIGPFLKKNAEIST